MVDMSHGTVVPLGDSTNHLMGIEWRYLYIYIYYIIYAIGGITNAMGHMGVSQMGEFIEKIAS